MVYQLAAYESLLFENQYLPTQTMILRIGRAEEEGFEERIYGNLDTAAILFLHALAVYNLQKEIKGEK